MKDEVEYQNRQLLAGGSLELLNDEADTAVRTDKQEAEDEDEDSSQLLQKLNENMSELQKSLTRKAQIQKS